MQVKSYTLYKRFSFIFIIVVTLISVRYIWHYFDPKDQSKRPFLRIYAHHGSVNSLILSDSGQYAASYGDDGYTKAWDTKFGKLQGTLPANKYGPPLAIQQNHLITSDITGLSVWDLLPRLRYKNRIALLGNSSVLSGNGEVTACFTKKHILIANAKSGKVTNTLLLPQTKIGTAVSTELAISPSGHFIAAFRDKPIYLWKSDSTAANPRVIMSSRDIGAVFFDKSENELIILCRDSSVEVYIIKSIKATQSRHYIINAKSFDICSYAVNSNRIAIVYSLASHKMFVPKIDYTVVVLDIKTGKTLLTLHLSSAYLNAIALSSDGHILAIGMSDGKIGLWSLP